MANYYGMIFNIDENMKRLTEKLEELNLYENTILIFLSDRSIFMKAAGDKIIFNSWMNSLKWGYSFMPWRLA